MANPRGTLPLDLAALAARIRRCTRCGLHRSRTRAVPGDGWAGATIALIGEAPGRNEDRAGRPFVGAAGRILDDALRRAGIVRERVFVTSIVKCRPPGNRKPRRTEIAACHPYLEAQLATVRPKVVVALGDSAIRALLGRVPPAAVRGTWRDRGGVRVLSTYHPAAVLYNRPLFPKLVADLRKARKVAGSPPTSRRVAKPPRGDRRTEGTTSAGCVIFDDRGRVLLLRRTDEKTWCFPKGGVEAGETLQETARREVREEAGLLVDIGRKVAEVAYSFYWPPDDVNYDKGVVYFSARPRGGEIRLEQGFDAWRWSTPGAAAKLLPYANDRQVLRAAVRAAHGARPRKRKRSS